MALLIDFLPKVVFRLSETKRETLALFGEGEGPLSRKSLEQLDESLVSVQLEVYCLLLVIWFISSDWKEMNLLDMQFQ